MNAHEVVDQFAGQIPYDMSEPELAAAKANQDYLRRLRDEANAREWMRNLQLQTA